MNSYELVNKLADLTNKEISDGTTCNGEYCEFTWDESEEMPFGEEYDGDVRGYVENYIDAEDYSDDYSISDNYNGTIHNMKPDCVIVVWNETSNPAWIFWAEEAEEEPDDKNL